MGEHRICTLSEIGTIVSGATPRTTDGGNFGGDIAWITPADLSGYTAKYISHGSRNLSEKGYASCGTQLIPKGSVLFSSRAPIGYVAIADNPVCTNQGFKSIVPHEDISSEYLYYQLKYLKKKIQDMGSGTTFKEISAKKFATIQVIVPPLSEQKSIVSRIEELFSQLDAGMETLKKIKAQLTVYWQAVLKEAFSDCADSVTMGSVATMIDPQPSHRTPPEFEKGIPYIGIGDIDYNEKTIRFKEARKVNPSVYEEQLQRYTLHEGDFVMGKIGTIGKPFRLPLPQNYTLSANVILIQPDAVKINPEYLFWQFSSPLITEQLVEGKNETSQPAFGIQKARLLQIKMCSSEKQERIVYEIRERLSVCENIEQMVTLALQQAEAIRQSILKEAFNGTW